MRIEIMAQGMWRVGDNSTKFNPCIYKQKTREVFKVPCKVKTPKGAMGASPYEYVFS